MVKIPSVQETYLDLKVDYSEKKIGLLEGNRKEYYGQTTTV